MLNYSIEAEQSVIGGLLLDATAFDRIAGKLHASQFYAKDHRIIFQAIEDMCMDDRPVDVITLSEHLSNNNLLDEPLAYLGKLAMNTPGAANIHQYAKIILNKALERELMSAANSIIEYCSSPAPIQEKIDLAQKIIMSISEDKVSREPKLVGELIPQVLRELDSPTLVGLKTGLSDLDRLAQIEPGTLAIIAGRPSMGKSALALQIADYVALCGDVALFFSMEMSAGQMVQRSLSGISRVDLEKMLRKTLDREDKAAIKAAADRLSSKRLVIDESPALNVFQIATRARRVKRSHGLHLIVIDYLQLMQGKGNNRNEEIESITRGLKAISKELNVPVILLSQLSRECERRQDKRPMLSDLRESGGIEQDADIVMMCYRDEYYIEDSPAKGTAEIIIRKNRNGNQGTCRLTYMGYLTRFGNYAGPEISNIKPLRQQGGFKG